jgi:hypothetical protein
MIWLNPVHPQHVERHPASQEYGCADGGYNKHVHVFGQEEEGEFDP